LFGLHRKPVRSSASLRRAFFAVLLDPFNIRLPPPLKLLPLAWLAVRLRRMAFFFFSEIKVRRRKPSLAYRTNYQRDSHNQNPQGSSLRLNNISSSKLTKVDKSKELIMFFRVIVLRFLPARSM
jgi:hypothetical protein